MWVFCFWTESMFHSVTCFHHFLTEAYDHLAMIFSVTLPGVGGLLAPHMFSTDATGQLFVQAGSLRAFPSSLAQLWCWWWWSWNTCMVYWGWKSRLSSVVACIGGVTFLCGVWLQLGDACLKFPVLLGRTFPVSLGDECKVLLDFQSGLTFVWLADPLADYLASNPGCKGKEDNSDIHHFTATEPKILANNSIHFQNVFFCLK